MQTLREAIQQAEDKKIAIGHFNISDTEGFWGVINAAKKFSAPVIIGVSEGERNFIGVGQVAALVKSVQGKLDFPVFLNADHTRSFELVKEAVDAGFDAVIFDGARLSLEENIEETKRAVEYAKSKNPDILIEGELGYIGASSKLLDEIPEGAQITPDKMTTPEEAEKFVKETGVDLLAPAVGNLHGILKNAPNPALDIERIKEIRQKASVPLVLHGGSGISDSDLLKAIETGISIVHVNTELRLAYRDAVEKSLADNPGEVAPYRFMQPGVDAIQGAVEGKLRLFNKR